MTNSTRPFISRTESATMRRPFLSWITSARAVRQTARMQRIVILNRTHQNCSKRRGLAKWGLSPITKILPIAKIVWTCLVFTAFNVVAGAQSTAARASASPTELYRQLLSPVFKVEDVYHLRQVAIDREDLHVVLVDGTIALMQAVDGHVTGAFFESEGEILLVPPNRAERTSLALFTSSGALDQKFQTAYLRFFDDRLFAELRSGFRPAENQKEFLEKWQEPAR